MIGQCAGYNGSCGQFYCAEHSAAKLCADCAARKAHDEAEQAREQAREAELQRIVEEYSQFAEGLYGKAKTYKRMESELGLVGPKIKNGLSLVLLSLMVVVANLLLAGENTLLLVLGVVLSLVVPALIPIIILTIGPKYIYGMDNNWKAWKGNPKAPSFLLSHFFIILGIELFILGVILEIFHGSDNGIYFIGGMVGNGVLSILALVISLPRAKQNHEEVMRHIERQKPGFRKFYREWGKHKSKEATERLKTTVLRSIVVAGAVTAAVTEQSRDTQIGRDIHDIADAARRLKK